MHSRKRQHHGYEHQPVTLGVAAKKFSAKPIAAAHSFSTVVICGCNRTNRLGCIQASKRAYYINILPWLPKLHVQLLSWFVEMGWTKFKMSQRNQRVVLSDWTNQRYEVVRLI